MQNTAKTVILSSLISLILLLALAYCFRHAVVEHIAAEVAKQTLVIEAPLESSDSKTISAIETANPAVVSVVVTKDVPVYERYYEDVRPYGWFGGFSIPRVRENGTQEREVGGGSGFIVSPDGLIVTNRHVVDDTSARYSILLNDGTSRSVEVLARDTQLDIAVLRVTELGEEQLPYLVFSDSDTLKLGQTVIAIGNALAEFRNSVSVGVVSGLARSIIASDGMGNSESLEGVIQTDAAINPGNSGGPLLDTKGNVVGVNVATSHGAENIGFALPADVVKGVVESVQTYGEIVRPYIGVRYLMLSEQVAATNEIAIDYGAWIVNGRTARDFAVEPGSPAAKAGLKAGDVITKIDGVILRDESLSTVLRGYSVGETVELTIWRNGEEVLEEVVLVRG